MLAGRSSYRRRWGDTAMSVYLFDMDGEPIAFRRTWSDPYLFALDGHWIGWTPWGDDHVVDPRGEYLGSVVDDRLVRRNDWCARPCTRTAEPPGPVTPTGTPSVPHRFPNRFAYEDVAVHHVA